MESIYQTLLSTSFVTYILKTLLMIKNKASLYLINFFVSDATNNERKYLNIIVE